MFMSLEVRSYSKREVTKVDVIDGARCVGKEGSKSLGRMNG